VSPQLAIFVVLATLAVVGAINLIVQRHPIHSALSLIVVMVALAGLYLLMGAEFVAAVQIIVYGGAIMVLFIFVIMLLNAGAEERTNASKLAGIAGVPLAAVLLGFLAVAIARSHTPAQSGALADTRTISMQLFQQFVYPFELTSFLILVAILGALVLAQRENEG
jgi:NADH-quinone oxidoreductase subunit J